MGMLVFGVRDWFLTLIVWSIMMARRIFLRAVWAMEPANYGGSSKFSRLAILHKMLATSAS